VFSLASLPLAALYMFAVLPAIDGFPMLVASMAPPLLFLGLYIPDPKRMGAALAVLMGFCNALALQETFSADFASFLNANLGQFVGLYAAIVVTAGMRSMGVDTAARRLLGRTWKGLARLARARSAPEPAAFAAILVDRLAILTPKLAMSGGRDDLVGVDALRDLRIGMNLVAVQAARPDLPDPHRVAVEDALSGIGDHFSALAAGRAGAPGQDLLKRLDVALRSVAGAGSGSASQGVIGLVGLRRNLFPDAPAFLPEPVA
ncbi:MAG: Fusaric acid resistance protein conserved region, partial [Phenylobacterium sp.]|nr:Fusaric acid resistance protein conserved region [Phenylobacterium sp.]